MFYVSKIEVNYEYWKVFDILESHMIESTDSILFI